MAGNIKLRSHKLVKLLWRLLLSYLEADSLLFNDVNEIGILYQQQFRFINYIFSFRETLFVLRVGYPGIS